MKSNLTKLWLAILALLLFCLLVPKSHAGQPGIKPYTLRSIIGNSSYLGDSLAAGATYASPAISMAGADYVTIKLSDIVPSASFSDSVAMMDIRVSPDSIRWSRGFELGTRTDIKAATGSLDSTECMCTIVAPAIANVPLSTGYLQATILPAEGVNTLSPHMKFLQCKYFQVRIRNISRPKTIGTTLLAVLVPRLELEVFSSR